jgi:hypothetical protein
MSFHEGSNWQAKKEDAGKPLYENKHADTPSRAGEISPVLKREDMLKNAFKYATNQPIGEISHLLQAAYVAGFEGCVLSNEKGMKAIAWAAYWQASTTSEDYAREKFNKWFDEEIPPTPVPEVKEETEQYFRCKEPWPRCPAQCPECKGEPIAQPSPVPDPFIEYLDKEIKTAHQNAFLRTGYPEEAEWYRYENALVGIKEKYLTSTVKTNKNDTGR